MAPIGRGLIMIFVKFYYHTDQYKPFNSSCSTSIGSLLYARHYARHSIGAFNTAQSLVGKIKK